MFFLVLWLNIVGVISCVCVIVQSRPAPPCPCLTCVPFNLSCVCLSMGPPTHMSLHVPSVLLCVLLDWIVLPLAFQNCWPFWAAYQIWPVLASTPCKPLYFCLLVNTELNLICLQVHKPLMLLFLALIMTLMVTFAISSFWLHIALLTVDSWVQLASVLILFTHSFYSPLQIDPFVTDDMG